MTIRGGVGGWTPNGENHLKFPFWLFEPIPIEVLVNSWHWVNIGHIRLYIEKVQLWPGLSDPWQTDWQFWKIEKEVAASL